MQPSHPGIKGQIELPQAHTHIERDLHLFLYSFRLHLQFEPQRRFSACQATFKENGNLSTERETFYFCLQCNPWKYVSFIIKNGPRERTRDWNLLQQLCVKCWEEVEKAGCNLKPPYCWSFILSFLVKSCIRKRINVLFVHRQRERERSEV